MITHNVGLGPAYNIQFEVETKTNSINFPELNLFKKGLNYLAPDQKLQFFLTSMLENFEEKISNPIKIKVIYYNFSGDKYEDKYIIDFSQLVGLRHVGEPSMVKIAKELEGLRKNINSIVDILRSLKHS